MYPDHFDYLSRVMSASISRRGSLLGVAAGVIAQGLRGQDATGNKRKKCKQAKKCAGRVCGNFGCKGKSCGECPEIPCQVAACVGGVCQYSNAADETACGRDNDKACCAGECVEIAGCAPGSSDGSCFSRHCGSCATSCTGHEDHCCNVNGQGATCVGALVCP